MAVEIGILNLTIAAGMLLYTSYLDLKKREVQDKVWISFGAVGAALQGYELWTGQSSWVSLAIALVLATAIGMGLFFFGFYGGADGKALIVLAVLVPYFAPGIGLHTVAPLIVLTNGVLISIALPIAMLILNAFRLASRRPIFAGFNESISRKILACFLGYRQTGKPRAFQFSMEKNEITEDAKGNMERALSVKKFDFSLMRDDFETQGDTWVTPGIPLLVFFAAGYFVLLFYGDLVIGLIQWVFNALPQIV